VVRRILEIHFRPKASSGGPSWLSFIGHAKDSLWSLDLFRCESAKLRTYWVLAVMDQFTRRIVGFCRSPWRCGWSRIVPDVQSGHSHADSAEISQFRP
jgi:transposase InsO family protein